jgi:hypothetical protein
LLSGKLYLTTSAKSRDPLDSSDGTSISIP